MYTGWGGGLDRLEPIINSQQVASACVAHWLPPGAACVSRGVIKAVPVPSSGVSRRCATMRRTHRHRTHTHERKRCMKVTNGSIQGTGGHCACTVPVVGKHHLGKKKEERKLTMERRRDSASVSEGREPTHNSLRHPLFKKRPPTRKALAS